MIYLSICIPTYNRVSHLCNLLESLVSQPEFLEGQVEIVISDNASTDGTEVLAKEYASRYPHLQYFRNPTNEGPNLNIYKSMARATGAYRKVSNDTFVFEPGSLAIMLAYVQQYERSRPLLVFANGTAKRISESRPHETDLDLYVRMFSYSMTWDAILGFWDTEFATLRHEDIELWFWTIRLVFSLIHEGRQFSVCNERLFRVNEVKNKNLTYGLVEVFYTQYLSCYAPFLGSGITKSTFRSERRRLLYLFFTNWFATKVTSSEYRFSDSDTVEALREAAQSHLIVFSVLLYTRILFRRLKGGLRNIRGKVSSDLKKIRGFEKDNTSLR